MSWIKESARVGITGMTQRQVVREALTSPQFQQLPDPLEPLIKEFNVSTLLNLIYLCNVERAEMLCYLLIHV